jgi:hypothetical protein
VNKEIKKHGEDYIIMGAPMPGKNTWTAKEYKDAIINDTWLENTTENPIDAIINFYNWQKRKEDHETNNK